MFVQRNGTCDEGARFRAQCRRNHREGHMHAKVSSHISHNSWHWMHMNCLYLTDCGACSPLSGLQEFLSTPWWAWPHNMVADFAQLQHSCQHADYMICFKCDGSMPTPSLFVYMYKFISVDQIDNSGTLSRYTHLCSLGLIFSAVNLWVYLYNYMAFLFQQPV